MKPYKIALTTGNKNSIGFEVAAKALSQIKASNKKNKALFFLFRHYTQEKTQPKLFKLIDASWQRITFSSLSEAFNYLKLVKNKLPDNAIIDLALKNSEAEWVTEAADYCNNKLLDGLVTGPLTKKITSKLQKNSLGHTGLFRNAFPKSTLFMTFVGKDFNVLLATDHMPLSLVESKLTKHHLNKTIRVALEFKALIKSKKPVAILGFNPHSGESGLIGKTEKKLFASLPKNIVGPLVPDAAFLKKNWQLYSIFICLYHDQGLIPFKMHHGQDSGVHLTMGLPFVRTSVDHGTAFELFNKNLANASSMLEAIELNLKLTGVKNV